VVYVWADGVYVKVVLAVESGQRESKESWGAVLRDRRARGLKPWRCTIADGHLGLWAALAEQQPMAAAQRCWNHRITTVLDAIPQKQQVQARPLLCAMPDAESQAACEALRGQFTTRDSQLAPKAVERLAHDWERLVTFSQFPREHWRHVRTTHVVESPLAAARWRTSAANRFKKVDSATAILGFQEQWCSCHAGHEHDFARYPYFGTINTSSLLWRG
jgi:putative transposase